MRIILTFLIITVIGYLIIGAVLYMTQDRLLFPQPPTPCNPQRGQIIDADGTPLHVIQRDPDKVAIILPGNAGSTCNRLWIDDVVTEHNMTSIIVSYTGNSHPSIASIINDATNTVSYAGRPQHLLIIGESIGSGPAASLARHQPDAIILLSTFDRLSRVAQNQYPIYPARLLLKDDLNNAEQLEQYKGRLTLIHGEADATIPLKHARRLRSQVSGTLHVIPGLDHNQILDHRRTREIIDEVVGEVLKTSVNVSALTP